MNKWMHASLCGMILLAASGCSGKEASPAATSPAAVSATPSPVSTATAAATPTPQVSATVTPAATAEPAATASPAAVASATPQTQASATPSPKPTPTPTPAPSVKPQATTASSSSAKAELLYKDNCLVCHGVGLTGDYGPNLTKVGSRRTKEQIVTQIMNGKVEMPPFKDKLKPDDIEVLANWLSSMK